MKLVFLIIIIISPTFIYSQQIISGVVEDKVGNTTLEGVRVINLNSQHSTITNSKGYYQIDGKIGDIFSYSTMGFETITKTIVSSVMNVEMNYDMIEITPVEVVAKANTNDIDFRKATASIDNISIKKIQDKPSVNILEALQGQVAGLNIKTDGELGKPIKVRIRGNSTLAIKTKGVAKEDREFYDNKANQPLYVLDGQIISSETFSTLNMNDIKSIKVLKDTAASALYGVKAANGVIEITTKRGINGPIQYNFSSQQGITLRGNPNVNMMQTDEKLEFEKRSKNINTPGYNLSEEYFRRFYSNDPNLNSLIKQGKIKLDSIKQIQTNWFKELSRISTYQNYSLSVRGGSNKSKFYISGSYARQGGKFEGNDIQRYTGKLNYEFNISKKIYVMFNSGIGVSENNTPNASDFSPAEMIYRLNAYEQKEKGILISYPNRTFKDLINQYSKNNNTHRFNFSTNIFANFSKSLFLSSVIGIDYLVDESLAITPRTAYKERRIPEYERGSASKSKNTLANNSANIRLTYDKKFLNHNFSFSANTDYYKNNQDYIGISGHGLPSKLNSGAGINNSIKGTRKSRTKSRKISEAQLGFGFSGLYQWKRKIDLYGSYKRDGSSLLPAEKRWNTFWAVGLGYTISKEPWLKYSNIISLLKFKATYGVTASLSGVEASLTVPIFQYGEKGYLGYREFYMKSLFNKDLKPEKNTSYNIGMDLGLFKKVNLSLEVYKRITSNMLLTVPISPSNGFLYQLKNVGVLQNSGVEFSANATLMKTKDFSWNLSANIAYNKNKVIDLYDGEALYLSGEIYPDYKEGEPSDLIYGLIKLGIFPANGIPMFKRADGSEFSGTTQKPNPEDFIILGYSTPPYSGGFYQNFSYKNWKLSFDLYFNLGGKATYKNTSVVYEDSEANKNAIKGQLEETWFQPGDENKRYPSLFLGSTNLYKNRTYATNLTTGSTDFIRINSILLCYVFKEKFLSKISNSFIKRTSIYTQFKNIATFSNFEGEDPESANLIGSVQPIITLGMNVTF